MPPSLRAAAALTVAGARAAAAPHRFFAYARRDAAIAWTALSACVLNLLCLAAVVAWKDRLPNASRRSFLATFIPLYLASVAASSRLYAATAAAALAVRPDPADPPPPRRAAPTGVRPLALRRAADAAAFRGMLVGAAFAQASLTRCLPLPEGVKGGMGFFLTCVAYAYMSFDAVWSAARVGLSARLAAMEAAWPFYAAFGAVAAGPGAFLAPFEGMFLSGALYPAFVVLAVDAAPTAAVARAAAVAGRRATASVAPAGRLPALSPAVVALNGLCWAAPWVLKVAAPPSSAVKKKVG